jgi:transposase-like protein
MSKRKKRTYDDKFRASAVIMLQAQGYPDTKGALQAVARNLGVATSTLQGWFNKTSNPPPPNIRREKEIDFVAAIKSELAEVLNLLPDKRDEATYRELVTAVGILTDKMRLLDGESTENTLATVTHKFDPSIMSDDDLRRIASRDTSES